MILGDDDPWRVKMGRFSDAEERLYARLFSFRRTKGSTGPSPRALAWRTRHVDGGWRLNDGPQVVVKAAGSRKSRSGVFACVRYVARLRPADREPVSAYDEFGRELRPAEVLKAVETWGLEADADNLSAAARRNDGGRLAERHRLRNIQAWHFVFSITATETDTEQVHDRLLRAAAVTVDAAFTSAGRRAIWALHTDCPGRPHIHVVVKAVSELGGRLRCDIHGDLFDTLRTEFASALTRTGIRFQAARREDRSELRDKIMAGQLPLRPRWRQGRGDGDLIRRAPLWFELFGPEYLARLRGGAQATRPVPRWRRWWEALAGKQVSGLSVPQDLRECHEQFSRFYRDPYRALTAWQWLAFEGAHIGSNGKAVFPNRRLAEWYVRHRPDVFGELVPGQVPGETLRSVLRKVELPPPPVIREPKLDPAIIHEFNHLRWRRRVDRDRRQVAGSLMRLARIAVLRTGDEQIGRRLVRRVAEALVLPIGSLKLTPPATPPMHRSNHEWRASPTEEAPTISARQEPYPSVRPSLTRPRRNSVER